MTGMAERVTMWFNPNCSKCRTADSILRERGVDYDQVRYLEKAPSLDELEQVLRMVGSDDPRAIMRTGESVYRELGLGAAQVDRDRLLAAMVEHPILIERPLVETANGVRLCRPQDRVREIL
jgi:arsenate reductase (glutaredoxin)